MKVCLGVVSAGVAATCKLICKFPTPTFAHHAFTANGYHSTPKTPHTPDRRTYGCGYHLLPLARGPLDPLITAILDHTISRRAGPFKKIYARSQLLDSNVTGPPPPLRSRVSSSFGGSGRTAGRYASAARAFISPTAFEQARGGALGAGGGRVLGFAGGASSESTAGSGRLWACGC